MKCLPCLICLLALFLTANARADEKTSDVLILIQPARASHIQADEVRAGFWVLWPPQSPSRTNQILSIPTGKDWYGSPGDARFVTAKPGVWRALNWEQLSFRGDLSCRTAPIDLLTISPSTSTAALLIAVRSGEPLIPEVGVSERWAPGRVLVTEARDWNDVATIRGMTKGRVLVIEYPPPAGTVVSRAWIFGPWPKDPNDPAETALPLGSTRVAGLARARDILPILEDMSQTQWVSADPGFNPIELSHFVDGQGRWLNGIWLVLITVSLIWPCLLVMRERSSVGWARVLELAALSPAAWTLTGFTCRFLGTGASLPVFCIEVCGLLLLSRLLGSRLKSAHPWWSLGLVGMAVMVCVPPTWSIFSPLFTQTGQPGTPEGLAGLLLYTQLVASLGGHGLTGKVARGAPLVPIAAFFWLSPWWSGFCPPAIALFLLASLIAGGVFGWRLVAALGLAIGLFCVGRGFAFLPDGLIRTINDVGRIDVSALLRIGMTPGVWIALLLTGTLLIFGDRFLVHRLRQIGRSNDRLLDLLRLSAVTAMAAIAQPWLLLVSLYLLAAGLGLLISESLAENDIEVIPEAA